MLALLIALVLAPVAPAAPVSLRYDPDARAVALAGPDVIVMSETRQGGTKVVAVPRTGGAARTLLSVGTTGYVAGTESLAASPERVAAIVPTTPRDKQWTVYSGPPAGPLVPLVRTPNPDGTAWQPRIVDVDGERLLLVEQHVDSGEARARMHTPATGFVDIAWDGRRVPLGFAGPYAITYRSSTDAYELAELATGAPLATLQGESVEERTADVAADGRIAVPTRAGILAAAPGTPQRLLPRSRGLVAARFFGTTVAALDSHFGPLSLLAPNGSRTTLGPPSRRQTDIEADAQGVVWLLNGCVRHSSGSAARDACPQAEVALFFEDDVRLRGRTFRAPVECVHARAPRCRGRLVARTEAGTVVGRGRFSVPRGERHRVTVTVTARAAARLRKGGTIQLDGRIAGGTVNGSELVFSEG